MLLRGSWISEFLRIAEGKGRLERLRFNVSTIRFDKMITLALAGSVVFSII